MEAPKVDYRIVETGSNKLLERADRIQRRSTDLSEDQINRVIDPGTLLGIGIALYFSQFVIAAFYRAYREIIRRQEDKRRPYEGDHETPAN